MSNCKHGRMAPDHILNELHIGQEGPQRHKCVECAFDAGREYGKAQAVMPGGNAECTYTQKRAPDDIIDALPESQAGKGRHKCAVCAYHAGFDTARAEIIGKQIGDRTAKDITNALTDPHRLG